jgi:hypothetical protein
VGWRGKYNEPPLRRGRRDSRVAAEMTSDQTLILVKAAAPAMGLLIAILSIRSKKVEKGRYPALRLLLIIGVVVSAGIVCVYMYLFIRLGR